MFLYIRARLAPYSARVLDIKAIIQVNFLIIIMIGIIP